MKSYLNELHIGIYVNSFQVQGDSYAPSRPSRQWRGFFGHASPVQGVQSIARGLGCHAVKYNPSSIFQGLGYYSFTPPSSSKLHIDSALPRDKGKRIVEDVGEAATQKRKAPVAAEGLMRDACKARQTKEGRWSSLSLDRGPEEAGNSASSAGQRSYFCISQRHEELSTLVIEMLPAHPAIMTTSFHKYWTQSWEKATEEATVRERLQLAEMNLARGFILAKELFSAFERFDAEETKSKKLFEDLKAIGLEKVQLESEKRTLQFKLDLVVTKEADMKAKYEIELKATKECLRQAQDQRKAAKAFQKRTKEAQKLAEDQTLVADKALAAANNTLEAAIADKKKSLVAAKLELERVRAE
ncbi:hypothetical protein Adt_21108 [Abeliophyllum distichum]|uniref:Uncharacterized protein n=1 Tax=Abeliophyllum distichum TaxID=126358 RepID=A0ABD1SYF4_9LAMI